MEGWAGPPAPGSNQDPALAHPVQVVVGAHDRLSLRGALSLLSGSDHWQLRAACESVDATIEILQRLTPDILLFGGYPSLRALASIRGSSKAPLILLVGDLEWSTARELLRGGVRALVSSSVDSEALWSIARLVLGGHTIVSASLREALLGQSSFHRRELGDEELTARERQVLELVAQGESNKTVAFHLGITEHTVKFHVSEILAKLGAASRTEAVSLAIQRGLVAL
ncbi:MAG: response regulator transcription factor [Chloroflexi bacterium]|nr:response regulator transcription factor [Chloroflexota bacterium]